MRGSLLSPCEGSLPSEEGWFDGRIRADIPGLRAHYLGVIVRNCLEIKLSEMLSLNPEDEKNLHPEALKWFNARRAEIQLEVPLEELTDDDLNTFLSDDEKREFMRCKNAIAKGLYGCMKKDAVSNDHVIEATIGLSLLKFEVDSLYLSLS